MASVSEMRREIKAMYGNYIRGQVVDYMNHQQIYCIYQSVLKKKKKQAELEAVIEASRAAKTVAPVYHQMTLWEWAKNIQ